jgi:hypothetical protein
LLILKIEDEEQVVNTKKNGAESLRHFSISINLNQKIYMPVNNAIAAIKAKKPKMIPIATKVSASSTEWIFFITYSLN